MNQMPLTKYYCPDCPTRKHIPERPSDAARTIRTGCEECGYIKTFRQLGVA